MRRALAVLLGPLWVTAFRDPVREGRLRLDALSRVERQVARAGLVLLAALLGSMLFATAWRGGDLLALRGIYPAALVPDGVVGLTSLALFVAWVLVVWGAIDAAPSVRLVVAVVFLLCLVTLSDPTVPPLDDGSWATDHGALVAHVAFYVVPGALVASASVSRLRIARAVDAGLRVVVLVALAGLLLLPLWVQAEVLRNGATSDLPYALDSTVDSLNGVTIPLLIASAVVVVDFALDVSTSLAEPARRLSARWALVVLLALVAAKLAHLVATDLTTWRDLLVHQPFAVLRTTLLLGFLAGLVAVVTRVRRTDDFERASERVIYLGALLVAAPYLLFNALGQVTVLWLLELDSRAAASIVDDLPADAISQWFPLVAAVALLATGVVTIRRSTGGYGDELGSAIVVVAGWNVPVSLLSGLQVPIGFSYPTIDVLVTLGALTVAVVAAVRRGSVPPAPLSLTLVTLLLFWWLVTSRGDYISFLGGLLGLSSVVVVVVGVLYGLASDSSFASDASPRLPADARPMLYVGFLLLSVTLLHWVQVTHEDTDLGEATIGFFRIGIPLAAWYLGRRVLRRGELSAGPTAALPTDA